MQQLLAFVRVLLHRLDFLFLNEASSALDAETKEAMDDLLLKESRHATIVRIAHRQAVAKFHHIYWQFKRGAGLLNTMDS